MPTSDSPILGEVLATMMERPPVSWSSLDREARAHIEARYASPWVVEQHLELYEWLKQSG